MNPLKFEVLQAAEEWVAVANGRFSERVDARKRFYEALDALCARADAEFEAEVLADDA
jgi:hypothetical protein